MNRLWGSILILVVAILASIVACGPTPTPPTQPPPQPTEEPPPPQPPQPSGQADLRFLSVGLNHSSQPGYPFEVVSEIANDGPVEASGFNAGCRYTCPGGTVISSGIDIVIGGYIPANSSFTYTQPVRILCEPIPAILDFTCTVNEDGSVPESNTGNNTMNYTAMFP